MAREDKELIVAAQRDASVDTPGPHDFVSIGTQAVIKRMARRPDGGVDMMVQGVERVVLIKIDQTASYLTARVRLAPVPAARNAEIEALQRAIIELARRAIELAHPNAPAELLLYTGSPRQGRPSMGSWVTYGLGSENENLPGFVVLISNGVQPSGGASCWSGGRAAM